VRVRAAALRRDNGLSGSLASKVNVEE
jgi:hypothetical protein